jgi:RHS repeat-associated protein
VRGGTGAITQTSISYTGQRLDGTGLLYYNARYYDPSIAKFVSADTIVPGTADGSGGSAATLGYDSKVALRPLTVGFHETQFATALNEENRFTQDKGFYFQLSDKDRKKAKYEGGAPNPQALNRYSYVMNNSLRYTDPSGHIVYMSKEEAKNHVLKLKNLATLFKDIGYALKTGGNWGIVWLALAVALEGNPLLLIIGAMITAIGPATGDFLIEFATQLNTYAEYIERNIGESGVIVAAACKGKVGCTVTIVNRDSGNGHSLATLGGFPAMGLGLLWYSFFDVEGKALYEPGRACTLSGDNPESGNWYIEDTKLCK